MMYLIKFTKKETYYECKVISKIDIQHNNIPNIKENFQGILLGNTLQDILKTH